MFINIRKTPEWMFVGTHSVQVMGDISGLCGGGRGGQKEAWRQLQQKHLQKDDEIKKCAR